MVMTDQERRLEEARKPGFGIGLLKGMRVLLKHLFKRTTTIQYPDEKQDLSSRTRGVIALKEENCTVCMLCARECPDWCIYIDSHKETLPPKREGGRQRKRNVLDRFAIDYALCMYCGICVEVCPYDALFWSREFEYAEYDIRELTHEKERLSDWMESVLPPPPLEVGADVPDAPTPAAAQTTTPAAGARPATQTSSAAAARPAQAAAAPKAPTAAATAARPKESEPGVDAEGARSPRPRARRRHRRRSRPRSTRLRQQLRWRSARGSLPQRSSRKPRRLPASRT
jgi:NADH-quinone oxidoreductase subunit I